MSSFDTLLFNISVDFCIVGKTVYNNAVVKHLSAALN